MQTNLNPMEYGRHKFNLECSDYCSELVFEYFDNEKDTISISHRSRTFSILQTSTRERFRQAIEIIWSIIRGKEYCFYEILIDDKNKLREFKEFVAAMDGSNLLYD